VAASAGLEHPDLGVLGRGRQEVAAGRPRHAEDLVAVAGEVHALGARFEVPDPDAHVEAAGREDVFGEGVELDHVDLLRVSGERGVRLVGGLGEAAGGDKPQLDRSVVARCTSGREMPIREVQNGSRIEMKRLGLLHKQSTIRQFLILSDLQNLCRGGPK